jgi:hypothetical protein
MLADGFERRDVEAAILRGFVAKKLTRDRRGTRYRIQGPSRDRRTMSVICRFRATGSLIIITVYEEGDLP